MVGIAVINYKTYEKTIECIDSIRETTKMPYKVFLLDNASPNESAEMLKKEYCDSNDVELILSDTNRGYAKGNNTCIDKMVECGCDYGVISNNDIICKQNTIDALIDDLRYSENFIAVGPRIQLPNGEYQKSVIVNKYGKLEYLRKSTYLYNFHKRIIEKEKREVEKINCFSKVSWVSGAFFAFDVKKMIQINKFDPETFLFFEEYILSKKASDKGYLIGYDPNVEVVHDHAFTTGGGLNIDAKIAADQSEMHYMKNYSSNGKIYVAILKLIRKMEVYFTCRKKGDFESIKKYKKEMHK